MQGEDTACRVTDSEVPGAPEPGTHSLTFLTKHELRGGDVVPLPPAQVALVRPTTPPGGLPALHPPSKVNVPSTSPCLRLSRQSESSTPACCPAA